MFPFEFILSTTTKKSISIISKNRKWEFDWTNLFSNLKPGGFMTLINSRKGGIDVPPSFKVFFGFVGASYLIVGMRFLILLSLMLRVAD